MNSKNISTVCVCILVVLAFVMLWSISWGITTSAAQAEHFAVETHCQELSDTNRDAPFDFGKCRAFYTKLYDEKGEL